ncbi:putative acetyltransferase protein [Roseibium aggregatum IAM 12614]|uniref:Putative acetyltransferase protein n=1 Tax=Roseibium aggregatum (strain ATCC 25650 / DSM 13394 / JCM 20685 / NBRC 16684 / NCIMB 2208 / IAM 12614 / B1) TaxID=384765 RepID=A0NZE6_ROSAI|nr:putative acetyltransferase protein [Roseibium aggregatum IAM 12614]
MLQDGTYAEYMCRTETKRQIGRPDLQADASIILDSYQLTLSPMTLEDIPKLHELSIGVNWPHRPHDWALLIQLGNGYVARDEIGRVAGSAMWFPMGSHRASVAMVITSPRFQDHGAGSWLMGHILRETGSREKILNATKAAYRLYISLGFTPLKTVFQQNGVAVRVPDAPDTATPMRAEHRDEIVRLDANAYGADRGHIFERLFQVSQGTVIERGGRLVGFALCREFGRGRQMGPVVAETEEDAIALIHPFVKEYKDTFLRMDTRATDGPLRTYLTEAGIVLYDTVTTMTRDFAGAAAFIEKDGPITFGLVNQALG